jgi:hypothetical protein
MARPLADSRCPAECSRSKAPERGPLVDPRADYEQFVTRKAAVVFCIRHRRLERLTHGARCRLLSERQDAAGIVYMPPADQVDNLPRFGRRNSDEFRSRDRFLGDRIDLPRHYLTLVDLSELPP